MALSTQVIFELKNAETLEVEETFEKTNTILAGAGLDWLRVNREHYVPFLGKEYWNPGTGNAYHTRLYLQTHDYASNPGTYRYDAAHNIACNSATQLWTYVDSEPPYWESSYRFNTPPVERTWKGATLSQDLTHIRISPPCVQAITQVLDVRYRIFRAESLIDSDSTQIEENAGRHYFRTFSRQNAINDTHSHHESMASPFDLDYRPQTWFRNSWDNSDNSNCIRGRTSHSYDKKQGRYKNSFTLSRDSSIGVIHNSMLMGGHEYRHTFSRYNLTHPERVSTVHHHAIGSTKPYEDIDFLSSSGGLPNVVNTRTENKLPEFLQIHYSGDGQVGDSEYMVRKQHTIGCPGNTYNRSGRAASVNMGALNSFAALGPGYHPLNSAHGCASHEYRSNKVELSPEQWVSYSREGVTVTDFADSKSVDFDVDNHSFTANNIVDVSVDTNTRTIYIGCSTTGVWRITDPFGAPQVTNFTNILNGIQDGGVMHIDVGYNSRVWAFFDGDLMYSDDFGDSWVSNNATNGLFSFNGLTGTGEWVRCRDMVCDRVDPGHIVGLIIDNNHVDVNSLKVLFYHGVDKSYIMSNGNFGRHHSNYNKKDWTYSDGRGGSGLLPSSLYAKGMLKVSKRHSVWTMTASASVQDPISYIYSINAYTGVHLLSEHMRWERASTSGFMYDNFDVPIFTSGNGYARAIYRANRRLMDDNNFDSHRSTDAYLYHIVNSESNRDYKGLVYNSWIGNVNTGTKKDSRVDSLAFNNRHGGAWGGKNMIFEDCAWVEYVWNGVAFVNKATWMQDAVDATGTHNATRKNFRANSYLFYGRQYLDITGNKPSASKITLIATYTPGTKPDQAYDTLHTLFDIQFSSKDYMALFTRHGAVKTLRLTCLNDEVFVGTTILDDATQYRIMLTIDGSSVKVYLDGVLEIDEVMGEAPVFSGADILAVGAHAKAKNYWTHLPLPEHFVSGEILNVQVWNEALTQADATADALDVLGTITPELASPTALTGSFALNEPLSELRTTHTSQLPLFDELEISFTDAASGQSFTDTDYHTMTVCEGILSDNTNSFNYSLDSYIHPTYRKYSVLNNQENPSVVPSAPADVVGARLQFGTDAYYMSALNGYAVLTYDAASTSRYGRVTSYQRFEGEVMIEFQPQHESNYASIGFAPIKILSSEESQLKYSVRCNTNGFITVYEDGVSVSPDIVAYNVDSVFRIRRLASGAFSLHSVEPTTGDETLIHESTGGHIYQGSAFIGVFGWGYRSGFHNIRYSCTLRNNLAFIGHLTDATGIYHEKFTATSNQASDLKMKIDGVDIAVSILSSDNLDIMVPLSAGEVRYFPSQGCVEFSTADFGKSLEFYTDVIHYPG